MKEDANIWLTFLEKFNGYVMFTEKNWADNCHLELYTDASGNKNLGCGAYFQGNWVAFKWPGGWDDSTFKNVTYLELVPIILAFYTWGKELRNKKIMLRSDNNALVEIIN
jgi:hypothetical protein